MTLDPCSGAYIAYIANASGTSLAFNLTTQRGRVPGGVVGGVVTVLAGRGAGQVCGTAHAPPTLATMRCAQLTRPAPCQLFSTLQCPPPRAHR